MNNFIKTLVIYYCFVISMLMTFIGFFSASSMPEVISASLFFPLTVYFGLRILPGRKAITDIPSLLITPESLENSIRKGHWVTKSKNKNGKIQEPIQLNVEDILEEQAEGKSGLDIDKRMFIKLIGSAGLSVFIFSLFTNKAHAAFFGSAPGPGTLAIKDSSGNLIDPAINQPTDGYKISEVDDSAPGYYGFVNKDGAWFIMKEDTGGAYRYTKGGSSFSSNWTNRGSLTYGYFDAIF